MASRSDLESKYHAYVAAINKRPFSGLANHMHTTVSLNDVSMPLAEFETILSTDINAAPDMEFQLSLLVVDESKQQVGCRIEFRCTPLHGELMGHKVQEKVRCMEHLFYQYREGKISHVWWMPGPLIGVETNTIVAKL